MKLRRHFLAVFCFLSSLGASTAFAGENWKQLDREQKAALRRGEILSSASQDPNYDLGQVTFYALAQTPRMNQLRNAKAARDCAAIFFDAKNWGQLEPDIISVDYVPLFSDGRTNPTLMNVRSRGLGLRGRRSSFAYSQLLGLRSYGNTYVASWLSLSPPLPGFVEKTEGLIFFEQTKVPFEVLIIYTAKAKATPLIGSVLNLKQNFENQAKNLVISLRNQCALGASQAQRLEIDSLLPVVSQQNDLTPLGDE